jgi:hypothetical protein
LCCNARGEVPHWRHHQRHAAVSTAPWEGLVMVTTKSLRDFAVDCLAHALKTEDPSQRETIIEVARTSAKTADVIDRHVIEKRAAVLPDLKRELN